MGVISEKAPLASLRWKQMKKQIIGFGLHAYLNLYFFLLPHLNSVTQAHNIWLVNWTEVPLLLSSYPFLTLKIMPPINTAENWHPFVTSLERFQLQMWHKYWQTPKPDQTSMQKKSEYILDKAKPLMGHINRSIKMHIKVSNINFIANFSSKCYVSKQYTYERLEADWSPLLPSIPPSKKEDCDHAVILTQRSCFIHRCYENLCES